MKVLVTGSAGHLGEALSRTLKDIGHEVVGLDILPSPFTTHVGSIADRALVQAMHERRATWSSTRRRCTSRMSRRTAVRTSSTPTSPARSIFWRRPWRPALKSFVFTSTTSVFGDALAPPAGRPAAWVTEDVTPVPKNIYGVTKAAAEDLCQLFHRNQRLACIVLRTSRFFPEEDDSKDVREAYSDDNVKLNEFLYRRVDIEDVVSAHLLAAREGARDRLPKIHHQRDHALSA